MEAKELRIGNLLRMAGADYEVSSIHNDNTIRFKSGDSSIGCFRIGVTKPIPLTEEWLVKGGGVESMNIGNYLFKYGTQGREVRFYIEGGNVMLMMNEFWVINIPYVHTWQNIFFALTNEELTIKQ